MTGNTTRLGSMAWSHRTGGTLSGAETQVPERALRTPASAPANTAEQVAHERLTPAVLNHSYRCYSYGVAIASLEGIDVDRELLFAAAMLHDTGLSATVPGVDFPLASGRIALEVFGNVGLSTAANRAGGTTGSSHLHRGAADAADLELLSPPPGQRHEEDRELRELPHPRPLRGVAAVRAGPDLSGTQILLLGAEAEEEEHPASVGS